MSGALSALPRALGGTVLALAVFATAAQTEAPTPTAAASPAVAVPTQDARSALIAEREAQTKLLDAAERACYARFFTTNCLLDVARSRRALQADLKRKEAALDTADRQQRAQDARLRLEEKLKQQANHRSEIDPVAIEQAQREKRAAQEDKQRDHAAKAAAVPASAASAASAPASAAKAAPEPQANPAKAPKADTGPSAQERAANQAAFDKKQGEAQRRITERAAARAKAAASGASAPATLPLPPPAPPAQ